MSERTKAAQGILPADHRACAELHCPSRQLAPDKQRLASKITACPEAHKASLAEIRQDDEQQPAQKPLFQTHLTQVHHEEGQEQINPFGTNSVGDQVQTTFEVQNQVVRQRNAEFGEQLLLFDRESRNAQQADLWTGGAGKTMSALWMVANRAKNSFLKIATSEASKHEAALPACRFASQVIMFLDRLER